jgi:hypothetical protein
MKFKVLFAALALTIGGTGAEPASDIQSKAPVQICRKAEFANCTHATCTPGSKPAILSCTCPVETDTSATTSPPGCVSATRTTVQSRYHPLVSYGQCVNRKQRWANCLGVTCEKIPGTNTANCRCTSATSVQNGSASYVIATEAPYASQCTNGKIYSSATPEQSAQLSTYLHRDPPKTIWFYPPDP